jgi:DNA-directed RNA polymerase subunit RPC12/RpoP
MGLIYCPNCKHKISSKSKKCHYCSYQITLDPQQKPSFKWTYYVHILIVIMAIIVVIPTLFHSSFQSILVGILIISAFIMTVGYKLINKNTKIKM